MSEALGSGKGGRPLEVLWATRLDAPIPGEDDRRWRQLHCEPAPDKGTGLDLGAKGCWLAAITVTYPGPPDHPSDAWRLVDAGSPLPRVGRDKTAASVPGTGSPAGAASRVGPRDLDLYGR